jgi:Dolichyl-phosphate-mannose-protein mannosyltransferase
VNAPASTSKRADTRNVLVCMGIVATAMLLVWPFADIGYGDDTPYAQMALVLSRTGHLVYNGWEAAFLILHSYWGALFIRLFGFSFVCLRLSTLPFALGAVGLCYWLVRRFGLTGQDSLLVTLLFGLSPLFLPVSVSFMTDVPAIFFMFASFYAFVRAEESSGELASLGWLALGVAIGFMGGTSRQAIWLVPLIVLPYLTWISRGKGLLRLAALLSWVLVLGAVIYTTRWFNRQLYVIFQPSVFSELRLVMKRPFWAMNMTARLGLMIVLITLPCAVPLLFRATVDTWRGPRGRQMIVGALLLLVLAAIFIHPSLASIPWIANTLDWEGINGSMPLPGRPIVLTRPIRAVFALAVYATICILAGEFWDFRRLVRRVGRSLLDSSGTDFAMVAMSLVNVAYFALLVVRSTDFDIFDRYLLPILPWAAALLLVWSEKDNPHAARMVRMAMRFAWVLLAILALYGMASTQDIWALAKARVIATRKLEAAGIRRTAIDAGFEYNAWTELMTSGHINSPFVLNPPGSYNRNESQTPSVVPAYRLEYDLTPETAPSEFGSVPYFSLLPPFHKRVRIDRLLRR